MPAWSVRSASVLWSAALEPSPPCKYTWWGTVSSTAGVIHPIGSAGRQGGSRLARENALPPPGRIFAFRLRRLLAARSRTRRRAGGDGRPRRWSALCDPYPQGLGGGDLLSTGLNDRGTGCSRVRRCPVPLRALWATTEPRRSLPKPACSARSVKPIPLIAQAGS